MQFVAGRLLLSATDLVNFLGCRHATFLDLRDLGLALGEDSPGDARELGGDGNRGNIALLAPQQALRPDQQAVLRQFLAALDHSEQALAGEHEVASDIAGALLGDATQLLPIGALPLPRHQTRRGRKGTDVAIALRRLERDREAGGVDRAEAGNRTQQPASGIRPGSCASAAVARRTRSTCSASCLRNPTMTSRSSGGSRW